jgi:carboxyl-terminal processing protease
MRFGRWLFCVLAVPLFLAGCSTPQENVSTKKHEQNVQHIEVDCVNTDEKNTKFDFLKSQSVFHKEEYCPNRTIPYSEFLAWSLKNFLIITQQKELEEIQEIKKQELIQYAQNLHILSSEKAFEDQQDITRLQAVQIILKAQENPFILHSTEKVSSFGDAPSQQMDKFFVNTALELEILIPKSQTKFGTHDVLTQKEAIEMLYKMHNLSSLFHLVQENQDDIEVLGGMLDLIEQLYVRKDAFDRDTLLDSALRGMVGGLKDEHSVYFNTQEMEAMAGVFVGDASGIGVENIMQDPFGKFSLLFPLEGSPAQKAGLKTGDYVVQVESVDITGMPLEEGKLLINGHVGKPLSLQIQRHGKEPFTVSLVPEEIIIPSLMAEPIDNYIVFVIDTFNRRTPEEFTTQLDAFYNEETKGIIIDLRNNGGGSFDSTLEILGYFFPDGEEKVAVHVQTAHEKTNKYLSGTGRLHSVPVAILVNDGSASAAEIFAAVMQDYERGIIVGQKSFGKGTIQETLQFLSNGSALQLTVGQWKTPLEKEVNKKGITPDVIIEDIYNTEGILEKAMSELGSEK